MTIGERIRARRKELHLTMKDIFNKESIQTGNLSELENDKYLPSVQTLISLSKVLDCSIDWILTGKEHASDKESLDFVTLRTEQGLACDGNPLTDLEADLIAMFRLLPGGQREEIFDLTYFKYKRVVELEKESIYSTYSDEQELQRSDPKSNNNGTTGSA